MLTAAFFYSQMAPFLKRGIEVGLSSSEAPFTTPVQTTEYIGARMKFQ
jgi:hypothetical protein